MLVGRETSEGLKPLGEVVGHEEGMDVRFELSVRAVMVALDGRLLEGSVHPLDLTIGPRMVGFGQPMLDAVGMAKPVEHMDAPTSRGPEPVLRQVRELDAVIGQHGVDFVGDGFDQGIEEVGSCPAIGFLVQLGVRRTSMSGRSPRTDKACLPRFAPRQCRDGSSRSNRI